jgi:hypothetical protein
MKSRVSWVLLVVFSVSLAGVPAAQAGWCGENGIVRLSFTPGPDLTPVAQVEPENGVTMVDLYAWLTDVTPLKKDGEAFMGTAAVEFTMVIDGAEGFIIKEEFPQQSYQMGKEPGSVIVGLSPGLRIQDGATELVHWQIMFQGKPENVVFRLDPDQLLSCGRTEGCPGSGVSALYTGTEDGQSLGSIFGAGHQRAYLNYSGKPDLEPIHGTVSWQDVGEYQLR